MHKALMHTVLRLLVTALTVVGLAYVGGMVSAQAPVKQIELSEKQIESFIAAQKAVLDAFDKMAAEASEEAAQKQIDAIAKQHGFKSRAEYEEVVANIDMVMSGLDPETKAFTDPLTLVRKDLETTKADETLSEEEKAQLVEELNEQLKMARPIAHPGNIELVKRYYDKIEPLLQ